MKNGKQKTAVLVSVIAILIITVVGLQIFINVGGGGGTEQNDEGETIFNLRLGHNLAEDHAVHTALTAFAEDVEEKSGGSITISIYPNSMLGSESDMLSQIQAGVLDMTKVSASTLGNFSDKYNAFSVPYVFDDKEHYYTFMDSDDCGEIFLSTEDLKFIGLTWLDSGSRSFYTKDTPIREPSDLKGLKIRTMDSEMAIDMMNALGGSATIMSYSEIYTGLQQGVIDGAENNITAMRDHGEVAHYYCYDEHTRIPDIIILSYDIWNEMSENQQQILKECALSMTEDYKTAWAEFEEEVKEEVETNYGDQFITDVDIEAFQEAVQSIYTGLKAEAPDTYEVVQQIRAMAGSSSDSESDSEAEEAPDTQSDAETEEASEPAAGA